MIAARRLLVLALLAAPACKGPPATAANKCVHGWPTAAATPAPAAPITGVTPAILWRKPITLGVANDWILSTDTRIAFTAGGRLYLLDHDGNYLGGRSSAAFEGVSSAVADTDGNFYFVGQNAYSTDADGNLRWLVPLDGARSDAPAAGKTSALAPDGTLYVGASDGALYALSTVDGTRRWRRTIAADATQGTPVVVGGIGNAVLAIAKGGDAETGVQLFDSQSGEPLQSWPTADGTRYGAMFGPTLGIVTRRMEDRGGPYPWMHIAVLDQCGQEKWTVPATRAQWPVLIGPGDQLYVVERDDVTNSPTFVSVYAPDGHRVLGPTAAAPPWAIGADGTIYGLACDQPGHDGPSHLIAYDAQLHEQWHLDLGDSCPAAGPAIDAQGRLFFTWFIAGATEMVAVQTTSPGLADAPWPARRRDVRGTAWVK